jgi:5'(3')-deoxyribonucleotidase
MKISVDLDGVILNCIPAVLKVIEEDYGLKHYPLEVVSWDFLDEWGLDEHYLDIFTKAGNMIMDFPIVDYAAPKILRIIAAKHDVDIVTGDYAPIIQIKNKLESIGIYVGVHYQAIIRTHESKADLDYDIFIDDRPSLAEEIKENQTLYLYDQPWNKDVKEYLFAKGNIIRVYNWDDILWSI